MELTPDHVRDAHQRLTKHDIGSYRDCATRLAVLEMTAARALRTGDLAPLAAVVGELAGEHRVPGPDFEPLRWAVKQVASTGESAQVPDPPQGAVDPASASTPMLGRTVNHRVDHHNHIHYSDFGDTQAASA